MSSLDASQLALTDLEASGMASDEELAEARDKIDLDQAVLE